MSVSVSADIMGDRIGHMQELLAVPFKLKNKEPYNQSNVPAH